MKFIIGRMSFRVMTQVSWNQQPQQLDLISMKELQGTYPLIANKFFEDLVRNIETKTHYYAESGFKLIIADNQYYEPHDWIFLWGVDFKDRVFWILFSRSIELGGRGAIAAVGPKDLAEFMNQTGKNAIVPTLTLLNDPTKMKSLAVIVSSPKEAKLAEKALKPQAELQRFKNWVDQIKNQKNVDGQWFPSHEPICPNCNERMLGVADIRIGFVQMVCPRCGNEKKQII
ncbi:MAG: hypothetical protein GY870_04260 [archaeon]|nr:hypothetical protein [archaeon]